MTVYSLPGCEAAVKGGVRGCRGRWRRQGKEREEAGKGDGSTSHWIKVRGKKEMGRR